MNPPPGLRILITGSRTWNHHKPIREAITQAVRDNPHLALAGTTITHGANPRGADAIAHTIALNTGATPDPHPADWNTHGRTAGPIRNQEMLDTQPDVIHAFVNHCRKLDCTRKHPHWTHGADNLIQTALKRGHTVHVTENNNGTITQRTLIP